MITLILGELIGVDRLMAAYGLASMCLVIPTLAIPSASGKKQSNFSWEVTSHLLQ